jgi:hypothetical protein
MVKFWKIWLIPEKLKLCYKLLRAPYFKWVPPGHFFSPLADADDVGRRSKVIFDRSASNVPGIDLKGENQQALLKQFEAYYSFLPFERTSNPQSRYFHPNGSFPVQDAFTLSAMIRHFKPNRIVEIGCGFSSCVILDTCEAVKSSAQITLIEPYPDVLLKYTRKADHARFELKAEFVQNIPPVFFAGLGENDILFVDTSHVSKVGSDVNFIFFQILPMLKRGVVVHFHDIFYPFEYPEEWFFKGMIWNEDYLLRAFLMFNHDFEILIFNDYLNRSSPEQMKTNFPLCLKEPGGSLWLRRT